MSLVNESRSNVSTSTPGSIAITLAVCVDGDESRIYALKAVGKKHIVDMRQQEHIFAEKTIMMQARSQFIVRMYTTFRDTRYVHMLLEACLAGELWTLLRKRKYFNDESARFYAACVVEAFDYLHRKHVAYRDLKPENCLLGKRGYLKLVDLGFAKKIEKGRKTWTFCGKPEYVSPEIILNQGHDIAVDYWVLGIYVCELIFGRPPFQASDAMKTYTLNGSAKRLLHWSKNYAETIPVIASDREVESSQIYRKHKWFSEFDWDGLRAGSITPSIFPFVASSIDSSKFDVYPPEENKAPEEFSGWDEGF